MLKGIVASEGIGIGNAYIIKRLDESKIKTKTITEKEITSEINRLEKALKTVKSELIDIKERAKKEFSKESADIIQSQIAILEDPLFFGEVMDMIRYEKKDAITCYIKIMKKFITIFKKMKEEYFRERAQDIQEVGERVIDALRGIEAKKWGDNENEIVLVGKEIAIKDLMNFDKSRIAGICVESFGRTSHIAIFAKTLEIPMIVGLSGILERVKESDMLIIDGVKGIVIFDFDNKKLGKYKKMREKYYIFKFEEKLKSANISTVTRDGIKVELNANIESKKEAEIAKEYGANSVGLYRTEYLFAELQNLPGEEEQFKNYKKVLEVFNGKDVVIRTFDLGGDKQFFKFNELKEENPFLGMRGIRISLRYSQLFKNQLKALLRASIYGNLNILFPMISSFEEIIEIKKIISNIKEELKKENIAFSSNIKLGVLIETPSSAFMIDDFSKEVDFFSIGTNDLLQFILAVDRNNPYISENYNPYHPAIFRSLKKIIERVHKNKKKASICGEMASNPLIVPVLLGFGVDNLSISPPLIPKIKHVISNIHLVDARLIADKIIGISLSSEIKKILEDFQKKILNNQEVDNEMP